MEIKMGVVRRAALLLIVGLVLFGSIGCQVFATQPTTTVSSSQPSGSTQSAPAPQALSNDFSTAVRAVAAKVKPAVVQITSEAVQTGPTNQPFTVPQGVGSGVIYDSRGYVLTNNHVIEGAQQLLVSLADGSSYTAKVLGADPKTDLAVIQISGTNLPVAELGDSTQLQVGDWVVAIGNALALPGGPTVTVGVVSALNRSIQEPGNTPTSAGPYLFDTIQTDAPINPGNSGGALVNLAGQVVGINTLVAGTAGSSGLQAEGIGFAISISSAKPIADQLVTTGKAVHPYLGIQYQFLTPALAARLGITQKQGVYIGAVVPGSPAASAGIKANDVITQIDGATLQDDSQLAKIIDGHKVGDTVTLTVARDGTTTSIQVKLGQAPAGS